MKRSDIKKGIFLIAHPELRDPNFRRTVVLVCEHGADGSMGLVLNRLLNTAAAPALADFEDIPESKSPVMTGGPVGNDQVYVLYRMPSAEPPLPDGTNPVIDGIHLVGSIEALQQMAASDDQASSNYRLYTGYSGWGPGQLEHEMRLGSWFICPASAEFVFDTPTENVWTGVLGSMGGEYKLIATMPDDLSVN